MDLQNGKLFTLRSIGKPYKIPASSAYRIASDKHWIQNLASLNKHNGGWGITTPMEFVIKHLMLMNLVPVVSYGSPVASDTKQVPTYQVYDVTAMKM